MTPVLSGVSVSDRSSRAIQQAVLDWRHEASNAPTRRTVIAVHLRSIVAIGRLGMLLMFEEIFATLTSGWAWWLLAWIALPMILNHVTLSRFDRHAYAMAALADYMALGELFPFCVFLAVATGRKHSMPPVLGLIAITVAVRVLIGRFGWLVVWHYAALDNAAWWLQTFHGHGPSAVPWRIILIALLQPAALILLGNRIRADRRRGVLLPVSAMIWVCLIVGLMVGRMQLSSEVLSHAYIATWLWLSRVWAYSLFSTLITLALCALPLWRPTVEVGKTASAE
jgi:hypothetical protein